MPVLTVKETASALPWIGPGRTVNAILVNTVLFRHAGQAVLPAARLWQTPMPARKADRSVRCTIPPERSPTEKPMDLARNLKVESVSRLHPGAALQLRPTQTVLEAVNLMRKEGVGCVLVCEAGRLVGIFT